MQYEEDEFSEQDRLVDETGDSDPVLDQKQAVGWLSIFHPSTASWSPKDINNFGGIKPDQLWTSNYASSTTLFAYRASVVAWLLLLMFWSGMEHVSTIGRAMLHLSTYAHAMFAMYLKFGAFFSARAAIEEVEPLCERDGKVKRLHKPLDWIFAYKWSWMLFEMCFTYTLLVFVISWLAYDHDTSTINNTVISLHNRGFTMGLVAADLLMSRLTFVPSHVWIAFAIGTVILLVNFIHSFTTKRSYYYFLDFNSAEVVPVIILYYALIYLCFCGGALFAQLRDRIAWNQGHRWD